MRWARTIRLSRGAGYAGLPITFATSVGRGRGASGTVVDRAAAARDPAGDGDRVRLASSWEARTSGNIVYAIPLRDLWGVAVWAAGLFGRHGRCGGISGYGSTARDGSSQSIRGEFPRGRLL